MASQPPATVQTLYSQGPIDPLPGVGPQRTDLPFGQPGLPASRRAGQAHLGKTRVRPLSPSEQAVVYYEDPHLISGAFWAYLVITIIVAVVALLFAGNGNIDWLRNLNRSAASPTETLSAVGFFLTFLIIIWAAYRGHIEAPNDTYRYVLIITYVIVLALIVIWAAILFAQRDPKTAFFLTLLLILAVAWWVWMVWPLDQVAAGLLILVLIWLGYIAWALWDIVCRNDL